MALRLVEPWQRYAAVADIGTDNDNLTTAWTVDASIALSPTGGPFGGQCLEIQTTTREQRIRLPAGLSGGTFMMQFRTMFDPSGGGISATTPQNYVRLLTSGGGSHFKLSTVNGSLFIYQNGGATLVGTVYGAFLPGVWHDIKLKVDISNTGTMTIYRDGVQIFTISSIDFLSTASDWDSLYLGGQNDNVYWSDLMVMDATGTDHNDLVADTRFELSVPDADGATANWTASAGSNYQCIDDALAAYNDDTDYISSSTTDQDNYASHGTISASGATVVQFACLMALARADAAGDKISLRVNSGTVGAGADQALINGTYRWRKEIWTIDPNTSSAWTIANINAAEWGVRKRV